MVLGSQDMYWCPGEHDTLKIELNAESESGMDMCASEATAHAAKQPPRKVLLVPFVRTIVPVVDKQQGFLTLDPPAGLLELAAVPKQPKSKKTGALGNVRLSGRQDAISPPSPVAAHESKHGDAPMEAIQENPGQQDASSPAANESENELALWEEMIEKCDGADYDVFVYDSDSDNVEEAWAAEVDDAAENSVS